MLARASHDKEETLLVECNLDKIDVVRTHWPFLRDRRIDAYGDLAALSGLSARISRRDPSASRRDRAVIRCARNAVQHALSRRSKQTLGALGATRCTSLAAYGTSYSDWLLTIA